LNVRIIKTSLLNVRQFIYENYAKNHYRDNITRMLNKYLGRPI